jgi:hypothetical protein
MRIFIATLMAVLLMVTGCGVTLQGGGHGGGHYRHSSHRHSRHHSHRHWNSAGPAYSEASKLTEITILPATLPKTFDGEFGAADETRWRTDWPQLAAKLVAAQLTERTDSAVTGNFSRTQPKTGYFMRLEITYIDVGDARPNLDGSARLRGSALAAHGVIVNAETNAMVADVKFTESSGWTGDIRFEAFMTSVGSSLGDWFKAKRKQ